MNIKKDILWRSYLTFVCIALFAVVIVVYMFRLQFVEGEKWRQLADSLSTDYQTIEAVRGNIYACDGSLLATSIPIYDIRFDTRASALTDEVFNNGVDSLALMLSLTFKDKPAREYKRTLVNARKRGERYFLLKRKVTYVQMKAMKSWPLFRYGKYKGGFVATERTRRQKPFQLLAERTIGYNVEGVAPVGLEGSFNEVLSGTSGKRLMQKVSGGVWVPINDENEIEPENGKDIISTIDVNIQDVAEEALYNTLVANNAQYGTAVLMEVATGEIKAIANLTKVSDGVYQEKYNYAIGLSAEPGSTMKLASMIALFEDGYVKPTDSVDTEGGQKRYFDRTMKDAEEGGHGRVSAQHAFEVSSNVAISKMVYANYAKQPQKFIDHLKKLHLHEQLGLQVTGEGKPHIKNPKDKDWYGTTLPWTSIGYEAHVTPLQMLALYNAIANNGVMVKPLLVREIQQTGRTIQKFDTEVIDQQVCSESTLKVVRAMMEGVVERGTAKNLKNPYYTIAGKTGTAQIADAKRGYNKVYQATFCGYFPADKPQYSCIVIINSPSNGIYYGSLVAGPVFKAIADQVYSRSIHMHPGLNTEVTEFAEVIPSAKSGYAEDLKTIFNRLSISNTLTGAGDEAEFAVPQRKDKSVELKKQMIASQQVPNVSGMGLKDALYLLENAGLRVQCRGIGKVKNQSISPGTRIMKGSTIVIELS